MMQTSKRRQLKSILLKEVLLLIGIFMTSIQYLPKAYAKYSDAMISEDLAHAAHFDVCFSSACGQQDFLRLDGTSHLLEYVYVFAFDLISEVPSNGTLILRSDADLPDDLEFFLYDSLADQSIYPEMISESEYRWELGSYDIGRFHHDYELHAVWNGDSDPIENDGPFHLSLSVLLEQLPLEYEFY